MSLVELMISLTLGLLVSLAATLAVQTTQQSFIHVDGLNQLQENGRLAQHLLQQIVEHAGYVDHLHKADPTESNLTNQPLYIEGWDNTLVHISTHTGPVYQQPHPNGSDVLLIRHDGSSQLAAIAAPSNAQQESTLDSLPAQADGSLFDCGGHAQPATGQRQATSLFYIGISSGNEPALMCAHQNPETGHWASQPLIEGIESLQIRYGLVEEPVDGNKNLTPPNMLAPQIYRPASELNQAATEQQRKRNWERVRTIRIGLVIRGPLGSGFKPADISSAATLYPLGLPILDEADIGTVYPAPRDGRLRHVLTFTISLNNPQF